MNMTQETWNKAVDEVWKFKGPNRWRASLSLAIKVNPTLLQEHKAIVKEVKEERKQLSVFNPNAEMKNGLQRHAMRIPENIMVVLQSFDPELKDKMSSKNKAVTGKVMRQLRKTFPEYCIGEK